MAMTDMEMDLYTTHAECQQLKNTVKEQEIIIENLKNNVKALQVIVEKQHSFIEHLLEVGGLRG